MVKTQYFIYLQAEADSQSRCQGVRAAVRPKVSHDRHSVHIQPELLQQDELLWSYMQHFT